MSPRLLRSWVMSMSVPRASGDEPKGYKLPGLLEECSPRERG